MKIAKKDRDAWKARMASDPAFAAQVAEKFAGPVSTYKATSTAAAKAARKLQELYTEQFGKGH